MCNINLTVLRLQNFTILHLVFHQPAQIWWTLNQIDIQQLMNQMVYQKIEVVKLKKTWKHVPVCFSGETANIDVTFVPLILLPVISSLSSGDLSLKLLISIICTRGFLEELKKLKSLKKKKPKNNVRKRIQKIKIFRWSRIIGIWQINFCKLLNKSYFEHVVLIIDCCIPVI